jgi:hypothetical protein
VSTQGSDSNSCTNTSTPQTTGAKRTINAGRLCLTSPGDVLNIRGGFYQEEVNWQSGAGAVGNHLIVQAYQNEEVIWRCPPGDPDATNADSGRCLNLAGNAGLITFRNIIWDGNHDQPNQALAITQAGVSFYTLAQTTDTFVAIAGSACAPTKGVGHPECLIVYENCHWRDIAQNSIGAHRNPVHIIGGSTRRVGKHLNPGAQYHAGANNIVDGHYFEDVLYPIIFWHQGVFDTHNNIARNNTFVRVGFFWASQSENGNHYVNGGLRFTQGYALGGGVQQSNGSNRRIYNNVWVDSAPQIFVSHGSNDCVVANNSMHDNRMTTSSPEFDASWMGVITFAYPAPSSNSTNNCEIKNYLKATGIQG